MWSATRTKSIMRMAERSDAVEAVRKHVGAATGKINEARRPIQSTVFEVLGIGKGKVSPA